MNIVELIAQLRKRRDNLKNVISYTVESPTSPGEHGLLQEEINTINYALSRHIFPALLNEDLEFMTQVKPCTQYITDFANFALHLECSLCTQPAFLHIAWEV